MHSKTYDAMMNAIVWLAAGLLLESGSAGIVRASHVTAASPGAAATKAPPRQLTTTEQHQLGALVRLHHETRNRLPENYRATLDSLTAHVRSKLFAAPLPADLLKGTTQIVSESIAELTGAEATILAIYALDGIAAATSEGGTASAVGGARVQGGAAALLQATRQTQERQQSFNLQYLQLQSQIQNENRSFTVISNIMKTKHDTVKHSIENMR